MSRSTPPYRVLRALIAALFLLVWGKSAVLVHDCPVHAGRAVAAEAAAAQAAGHDHGGDHGGGHGGGFCRCVGEACPTLAALAPTAETITWREVLVARAAGPTYEAPAAPRAPSPRLLPFANGPPSLT